MKLVLVLVGAEAPQSDIETLQRAAGIMGRTGTTAKASQPKAKRKRRKLSAAAKGASGQPTATPKRKRKPMSTAAKKALSKRMKAYWAKRRKTKG